MAGAGCCDLMGEQRVSSSWDGQRGHHHPPPRRPHLSQLCLAEQLGLGGGFAGPPWAGTSPLHPPSGDPWAPCFAGWKAGSSLSGRWAWLLQLPLDWPPEAHCPPPPHRHAPQAAPKAQGYQLGSPGTTRPPSHLLCSSSRPTSHAQHPRQPRGLALGNAEERGAAV